MTTARVATDEILIPNVNAVSRELSRRVLEVCKFLLTRGEVVKKEWCVGSLSGESGRSLKVRVEGDKAGVWKDFSTGDSGDMIGLWKRVKNLSAEEAAVEALDWMNLPEAQRVAMTFSSGPIKIAPRIETRAPSETWLRVQKQMRPGSFAEISALGALRQFPSLAGLELATRAGQLWFADIWDDGYEWPSWIITDGARHNAQARRCDGKPFDGVGAKAKTIKGCEATWPVGITEAKEKTDIFLVEGGPDLLAAWHLIWMKDRLATTTPVAMFGVANAIHDLARPLFAGKNVRIFPHNDPDSTGVNGAIRWRNQLKEAGAAAVGYGNVSLDGVKDLNEFITKFGLPEMKEVEA